MYRHHFNIIIQKLLAEGDRSDTSQAIGSLAAVRVLSLMDVFVAFVRQAIISRRNVERHYQQHSLRINRSEAGHYILCYLIQRSYTEIKQHLIPVVKTLSQSIILY